MSNVVSLAEYRRRRDRDATVRWRRDRPKHLTRGTPEERVEGASHAVQPDNDNGTSVRLGNVTFDRGYEGDGDDDGPESA